MIFSKEDIRKYKEGMVVSEDVKVKHGACPVCSGFIAFSVATTADMPLSDSLVIPALNEFGVAIGECEKCEERFKVSVINPDLCFFSSGATKVGYFILGEGAENELAMSNIMPSLEEYLDRELDLNKHSQEYDSQYNPLYHCMDCDEGLDSHAFEALEALIPLVIKRFDSYLNWWLANGGGSSPEFMIVRAEFGCSCGRNHIAFFSKSYAENYDFNEKSFSICNIIGSKSISQSIQSGVYSKDQVTTYLYKLFPRWTVLFDRIYIITPFIGHQWLKKSELVSTWFGLIGRLNPQKTKIVTRHGQMAAFKKAYEAVYGTDYEKLERLKLGSRLISETKQSGKFHAKIYCAVSESGCEVFSGSANLVGGPSKEVMHFNEVRELDEFRARFLEPLGLGDEIDSPRREPYKPYSLLFHQACGFDPMKTGHFDVDSYWRLIFHDIQPKPITFE